MRKEPKYVSNLIVALDHYNRCRRCRAWIDEPDGQPAPTQRDMDAFAAKLEQDISEMN
jgi:hypothetical protein